MAELTLVDHREEALRRMRHEVGDGHLAGQDKGDRAREQADEEQEATDHLEHARKAGKRKQRRVHAGIGEAEQLGRAVRHEEQRSDDPQDREKLRAIG